MIVACLAGALAAGVLVGVPLAMGPMLDAGGACVSPRRDATTVPGAVGEEIEVRPSDGASLVLGPAQLANARAMLRAAVEAGADARAAVVLIMAALQESRLRNLANAAVPESFDAPHDGAGSDHDSLGVLQQRPSAAWGTAAELMDPAYAARAFLGGPAGPNAGAPPGLLDLVGWADDPPGTAAQRVQVSAFPDAYDRWFEPAVRLIAHLGGECAPVASGEAAYPLATPAVVTDLAGPRPCRVAAAGGCASSTWHPAVDLGAACGTPVLAARPGTVTVVSGYWVSVTTEDGTVVSYLHMYPRDVIVALGDRVAAGQRIGAVGSAGPSTGCHLDLRVNTIATTDARTAALPHIGDARVPPGYVDPVAYLAAYGVDLLVGGVA